MLTDEWWQKLRQAQFATDGLSRKAQAEGVTAYFPAANSNGANLFDLFTRRDGVKWQIVNAASVGYSGCGFDICGVRFVPFPDDLIPPASGFIFVSDGKRYVDQFLTARASLDALDQHSELPDFHCGAVNLAELN